MMSEKANNRHYTKGERAALMASAALMGGSTVHDAIRMMHGRSVSTAGLAVKGGSVGIQGLLALKRKAQGLNAFPHKVNKEKRAMKLTTLVAFVDEIEKIAAPFTGALKGPMAAEHVKTIKALGGVKPAQMANATAGAVASSPSVLRPQRAP